MSSSPALDAAGWACTGDGDLGDALTGFLRSLAAPPRLLGLGEPMHGEEAFPELRNQLFRHLVEHEGYRSIALESDCVAGLAVDDFVAGGAGSLDEVMRRGFSHGFGESAANRELVRWMREQNANRPAAERLRFFGFDAPIEMTGADSPRRTLTALHGYLSARVDADLLPCDLDTVDRLIGDDERWTEPRAAVEPDCSVGATAEAARLRLVTDDLLALLVSESPRLVATTSRDDWWRACLHGRTAAGLLRYHAEMASTSPARVARLLGLRDAMMADNLDAIVRDQERRGPTLVFAHNRHLQRDQSRWEFAGQALAWWSAGAIVGTRLGDRYAFLASALGTAPHHGIDQPAADTLEGVLSTLPADRHILASARLVTALAGRTARLSVRADTSIHHGYFPLDPAHLDGSDGVVFVKRVAA